MASSTSKPPSKPVQARLVLQTLFFDTGTQTDRPGAVKTLFQLPYIVL